MGQDNDEPIMDRALEVIGSAANRPSLGRTCLASLAGLLLTGGFGLAQPAVHQAGGPPPSLYRAEVSATAAGQLDAEAGSAEVEAVLVRASYTHQFPIARQLTWGLGPIYQGLLLETDDGVPLPDDLHGVALGLSLQWLPADRWWVRMDVRPGIYSDWVDLSGQDFNAPALVAVGYQIHPNLTLVAGINVNLWSRLATIGGPGVAWQITDSWRLNLVLPRPVLEYAPHRSWAFYAGGEIQGGSYRLAEDFGNEFGRPELNGDKFAYREIRVLGGARWSPNRTLRVSLEAGYAADREFEFRDADWEFGARGAPFIQVLAAGAF